MYPQIYIQRTCLKHKSKAKMYLLKIYKELLDLSILCNGNIYFKNCTRSI